MIQNRIPISFFLNAFMKDFSPFQLITIYYSPDRLLSGKKITQRIIAFLSFILKEKEQAAKYFLISLPVLLLYSHDMPQAVTPRNTAKWHVQHIRHSLSQTACRSPPPAFRFADILLPDRAGCFSHCQAQTLPCNSQPVF